MSETGYNFGRTRAQVVAEIEANDPPIMPPYQCWSGKDKDGTVLRRVRILGRYYPPKKHRLYSPPLDGRMWIYQNMPGGKLTADLMTISYIAEFNLRYVYRPEDEDKDEA